MTYLDPRYFKQPVTLTPEDAVQLCRLLALILGSEVSPILGSELPIILRPEVLQTRGKDDETNERSDLAKRIHDSRRARDKFFPAEVFADPAWDILLFLYWANHKQQRLSVTSVSLAAAVPATTALRWIENLAGLGLVRKNQHPTDRRVTWLDLSDNAKEKLDQYFDELLEVRAFDSGGRS